MSSKFKDMFKKGISSDDCRSRREQTTVALRKEKKEEGLAKRRNMMVDNFMEKNSENSENGATSSSSGTTGNSKQAYSVADIPSLLKLASSVDIAEQVAGIRGFRRLLSCEKSPPVQECVSSGAIPYFVSFLQREDCTDLQFEAAWALTNIASTNYTKLIVECGSVPHLTKLLTSAVPDIREQAAWCLGNVAGDGPELRNFVLNSGALQPLVMNVMQPASLSLMRNCVWALSNFCRGKPQPSLDVIKEALPALRHVVQSSNDQETIIDATWALSYISDGDNGRIQSVVDLGIIPSLIQMLLSGQGPIIVPALRTLGNIVSGSNSQTQAVIDCNALSALVQLLSNTKKNIRKESCWMLSNIAAGSPEQLTLLMSTPGLVSRVLEQLSASAEWDVRREAAWVVSNISTSGSKANIAQLVEFGAIRPLCELLDVHEVKIIQLAMESLQSILKVMKSDILISEKIIALVEEAEGIDKLEALQEHENEDVYNKAVQIIEQFFGGDEGAESENLLPLSNGSSYTFGFGDTVTGNAKLDFGANNPFIQQPFTFTMN